MANNIKINNPQGSQPQQKKGSGFVNLNKILQANAGNQLGQTVSQGINQGTQKVQSDLGQIQSQFQSDAEKNNLASDQNKQAVSDALNNIAGGQPNITDEQTKQFGTFLSGQYAGPKGLDESKTAQVGARAQEVQGFGQALSSGGDKTRVLQAFAGKGPYSAGQTRLDSLLLGKGPNAKEQLDQARQGSKNLVSKVGAAQDTANQVGQLRTTQARDFGQQTGEQLKTQEKAINSDIGQALTKAQADKQAALNRYMESLQKRDLGASPDIKNQLAQAGIYGNEGVRLFGIDPTKAIQQGEDASLQNIASLKQRSQLEALAKLGQKDPSTLGFASNVYDPNQAVTLNTQALKQQLAGAQGQYNTGISDFETL